MCGVLEVELGHGRCDHEGDFGIPPFRLLLLPILHEINSRWQLPLPPGGLG